MVSAYGAVVTSATHRLAGDLADAMANHDDAATVEAAGPAYLLMMDALVRGNPEDSDLLVEDSGLYRVYAGQTTFGNRHGLFLEDGPIIDRWNVG